MLSNSDFTSTRWIKMRNIHGQLTIAYTRKDDDLSLGVSFCNPKDFSLPRRLRVTKGQGIALGRLSSSPVVIELEKSRYTHEEVRSLFLKRIASNPEAFGIDLYHGKDDNGDFQRWFTPFVKEERAKYENVSDNAQRS